MEESSLTPNKRVDDASLLVSSKSTSPGGAISRLIQGGQVLVVHEGPVLVVHEGPGLGGPRGART